MPMSSPKTIVFTDLDGTLLDDETYSVSSSLPALRALQARGVHIVLCSSKTRSEQVALRDEIGVRDSYIVENGSAIVIPPNTAILAVNSVEESDGTKILILGKRVDVIRASLKKVTIETHISYKTFYDLSPEEVSQITGLDLASAKLAKTREFSETIVSRFSPYETSAFIAACESHGLQCTQGGRFLSVTGGGADKGRAARMLTDIYRLNFGDVLTVGIGDSPNDAPLLREVDLPYLVQRPNGQWKALDVPNLNRLAAIGPLGFVEMANDLIRSGQI